VTETHAEIEDACSKCGLPFADPEVVVVSYGVAVPGAKPDPMNPRAVYHVPCYESVRSNGKTWIAVALLACDVEAADPDLLRETTQFNEYILGVTDLEVDELSGSEIEARWPTLSAHLVAQRWRISAAKN
jgi:hypothetical protein